MIEMWIRWCVLLQKVQLFQLPCLCRRALYFMIQTCCEHSPFVPLLCSDLLPVLGLFLSSHVYGSSWCCKVKSNNLLAAALQLFWTTLRPQSLSHFVYSLKSNKEDKSSLLLLTGTHLWLQVVFGNIKNILLFVVFTSLPDILLFGVSSQNCCAPISQVL